MLKQDDLHIQISKTILNLGANEAYIYSILSKNSLLDGGAMVHLPQLAEMLGIGNRTENREKIKQSLVNLESELGLEFYSDFQLKKSLNLLDLKGSQYFYTKVPLVEDNFVKMSLVDFNKLVYISEKECKQMIMFQYLYIVGMVNESGKERKISYPNIEQIAEATGFDRKTVIRYNEILTKYELIYIDTITINNKSKNIYSRWNDKEDVLEAVAEAKNTGHISKIRKKQQEAVVEAKKEIGTKATTQKSDNTGIDPSIIDSLQGFVKAGLKFHKSTKARIDEAIKICGEDNIIIIIKTMESKCRGNMPSNQWAGYFFNNLVSEAQKRNAEVEAQKRANEKLMKEPVREIFDYNQKYRETHKLLKEREYRKKKEEEAKLLKELTINSDKKDQSKENWLLALKG